MCALVVGQLMPTMFLRGLVVGAALVAGPALVWSWTVQATGTAPIMMGEIAEQWTAAELRKLRSRGWRIVNHFALAKDDIDHVLIGPGGIAAIETKWIGSPWSSSYGQTRVREAVIQSAENARRLRLWHPVKSRTVGVTPVIVLWGRDVKDWPRKKQVQHVDGVAVVVGPALADWARELPVGALTGDEVAGVWSELNAHVIRRDPVDRLEHPVPPSVEVMVLRAVAGLVGVCLGFFLMGELVSLSASVWFAVGIGAVTLVPAVALIRRSATRFAAWGWLAGVGMPGFALAVASAMDGVSSVLG